MSTVQRKVFCQKLKKESDGLTFAPLPGPDGLRIFEHISTEAWSAWLHKQTMLINENRLNLSDQRAREFLKRQRENELFGDGADAIQGYVPPNA
jgi:Fe-S cluster biosynthesis and repair protein YggX